MTDVFQLTDYHTLNAHLNDKRFEAFPLHRPKIYYSWAISAKKISTGEDKSDDRDRDSDNDSDPEDNSPSITTIDFKTDICFVQRTSGQIKGMYLIIIGTTAKWVFSKEDDDSGQMFALLENIKIGTETNLLRNQKYHDIALQINKESINLGFVTLVHKTVFEECYELKYDKTCNRKKHRSQLITNADASKWLPEYIAVMTGDFQHAYALNHKSDSNAHVSIMLNDLNKTRLKILDNFNTNVKDYKDVGDLDEKTEALVKHLKKTTEQQRDFVSSQYSFIVNGDQLTTNDSLAWKNVRSGRVGNIHEFDDVEYVRDLKWDACKQTPPEHEEAVTLTIRTRDEPYVAQADTFARNLKSEPIRPRELELMAMYVDDKNLCVFEQIPDNDNDVDDGEEDYTMKTVLDARWLLYNDTQAEYDAADLRDADRLTISEYVLKEIRAAADRGEIGAAADLDDAKRKLIHLKKHTMYKIRWKGYNSTYDSWISSANILKHSFTRNKKSFSKSDIFDSFWNKRFNLSMLQGELFFKEMFSNADVSIETIQRRDLIKTALKHIGDYPIHEDYVEATLQNLKTHNLGILGNTDLFKSRQREEKWAKSGDLFVNLGMRVHNILEYDEVQKNVGTPQFLHAPNYDDVLQGLDAGEQIKGTGTMRNFLAPGQNSNPKVTEVLLSPENMNCSNETETAISMSYNMKIAIKNYLNKNKDTFGDNYRIIATEYSAYYPLSVFKSTRSKDMAEPKSPFAKAYNFLSATPDAVLLTSKGKVIIVEYKDVMENPISRKKWLQIYNTNTQAQRCVKRILDSNYTKQAFYEAFIFHAWTGIRPDYVMTVHATRASPRHDKQNVLIGAVRCVEYNLDSTRFWNRCRFLTNIMSAPFGQGTTDTAYMDDAYYIPSVGALLESHVSLTVKNTNLCAMFFGIANKERCGSLQPTSYLIKWMPCLSLFDILLTEDDRRQNDIIPVEKGVLFYSFDDQCIFTDKSDRYNATVEKSTRMLKWMSCGWLQYLKEMNEFDAETLNTDFFDLFEEENKKDVCTEAPFPYILCILQDCFDAPSTCFWAPYVIPILGKRQLEDVKSYICKYKSKLTTKLYLSRYVNSKHGTVQRAIYLPQRNDLIETAPPLKLPLGAELYHIYGPTSDGSKHVELNDAIKQGAKKITKFVLDWLEHYTLTRQGNRYAAHVWQAMCYFREIRVIDGTFVPEYIFPSEGGELKGRGRSTKLVYKGASSYYKKATYDRDSARKCTFFQMAIRTLQRIINSRVQKAFIPTAYITSTLTVQQDEESDTEEDEEEEADSEDDEIRRYNSKFWDSESNCAILNAGDSVRQVRSIKFRENSHSRANAWYGYPDLDEDEEEASWDSDSEFIQEEFTAFDNSENDARLWKRDVSLAETAEMKQSMHTQTHNFVKQFLHNSKRGSWSNEALHLAMDRRPETGKTPIEEAVIDLRTHLENCLPVCIDISKNASYVEGGHTFIDRSSVVKYKHSKVQKALAADFMKHESKFMK